MAVNPGRLVELKVRAAVNAFGVCCVHPSESSADHFSVRWSHLGWFVFEDLIRRTRFPVRLSVCNVETRCRFYQSYQR